MKSYIFLLLALVVALRAAPTQLEPKKPCPSGYTYFDETNRCYSVHKVNVTFEEAREACEKENSTLVSIHSYAENDFLSALTPVAWIGMRSRGDEHVYGWIDRTPAYFNAFAAGEPSSYTDFIENCVELLGVVDLPWLPGMWNNMMCNKRQPFICKKGAVQSTNNTENNGTLACANEEYTFFERTKSCYKLYKDDPKTVHQAIWRCDADNASLATIRSEEENAYLTEMAKSISSSVTIGLYSETNDEKNFTWFDETPLDFTSWAPGEPGQRTAANKELCVSLYGEFGTLWNARWKHRWNNEHCDEKMNFICAKPADAIPKPSRQPENRNVFKNWLPDWNPKRLKMTWQDILAEKPSRA